MRDLHAAGRRLAILEYRTVLEPHQLEIDSAGAQVVQLARPSGGFIDAHQSRDAQPQGSSGARRIGHAATEPPAARIVAVKVARGRTDHHEVWHAPVPILVRMALGDGEQVYFYELHENDDELFEDLLLAHDSEFAEDEFLALVTEARAAVIDRFEQDTLIEAVAAELASRHGFRIIDDSQLRVAVNVSANEGETRVVAVDERRPREADPDDGYRSLLVDVDREERLWGDA